MGTSDGMCRESRTLVIWLCHSTRCGCSVKHISTLILIPTCTNIIVQMYTTKGLYAHSSNLEVIRIYLDPMLMSLFLSGHFLVVLPHQFFCLLVKECVQLIFHQNVNETINSFVDFAIHEVRIVLELVVEAKKIILEFHHVLLQTYLSICMFVSTSE